MQDHSSVFGAELFAIRAAILKIKDLQNTTCCIYSDSKSALEAINKFYSNHPIVQVIQEQINLCKIHNSEVMLCWIPGHVGIEGNNLADKVAKDATKLNTKHFKKVSFSDVKELVRTKITQKWQQKWNILVNGAKTPLAEIILKVNQTKHCEKLTRTECLKYNRLRVGHTKFVKQFMVKQEVTGVLFVRNFPYLRNFGPQISDSCESCRSEEIISGAWGVFPGFFCFEK